MGNSPKFRHYSKEFIREVFVDLESGVPRWKVCEKYGVSYATLQLWIPKYGSDELRRMRKPSFTGHQKRAIVSAILNGRMSIQEACVANGVKVVTIKERMRKSRQDNPDIEINQSSMPASNENDLRKALQASQLKILALETLIDVAEQEFKIKIRKKSGAKQ